MKVTEHLDFVKMIEGDFNISIGCFDFTKEQPKNIEEFCCLLRSECGFDVKLDKYGQIKVGKFCYIDSVGCCSDMGEVFKFYPEDFTKESLLKKDITPPDFIYDENRTIEDLTPEEYHEYEILVDEINCEYEAGTDRLLTKFIDDYIEKHFEED